MRFFCFEKIFIEKRIIMKENPVAILNGNEFGPIQGQPLKNRIEQLFKSQGGLANTPFGEVVLDKKGIKNDLWHPNYLNKTHSFAAIKDDLEKGKITTPFDYHEVHGKNQPTGILSVHIF